MNASDGSAPLQSITVMSLDRSLPKMAGKRKMVRTLKAPYQSLNTEALELRTLGVLQKDVEGVWSLVPGIDPAMYGVEVITSSSTGLAEPWPESSRTLKDEFRDLLRSAGVKKGVEAITDIYFSRDYIWDAEWLYTVLTKYSEGFITEEQGKLIMAYWAITKGVPYEYEDFFEG